MILRFTVPVPTGSKNSRRLITVKGKPRSLPSDRAVSARKTIRIAAMDAAEEATPIGQEGDGTVFGPDDDIGVAITHKVGAKTVLVEVWRTGPKQKPPTGRGRDIDNFASTIMDALQGIAYKNDNQVSLLEVERDYSE